MPDTLVLSVPDMSCGHCRASIESAVRGLGAEPLSFDMAARRVTLPATVPAAAALAALDAIGFPAAPVEG